MSIDENEVSASGVNGMEQSFWMVLYMAQESEMKKKYDIESERFYNLMQDYRHAPLIEQDKVCKSYEKVKKYIANFVAKTLKKELEKYDR